MAKLILTHEVDRLGQPGDVVDVKDGYARNFLIPRGYATRWTKGAQKQIDQMAAARRKRDIASVEEAQTLRDKLEEATLTIKVRTGNSGRLFGAVTAADIAQAAQEQTGEAVDRRKVMVANPIKSIGTYRVEIRLHSDVSVMTTVDVVAE
ncbi:50S ribosomal protein L9 [Flaviflexus salsibiostraticola]|uniref:Large ribosomal subunit protein bL9 n=1 Tax=Flaviflexus salsibiostraticola TaxID=1282737 RepID=A0A3S8Z9X0_9ACTO|nr:50S ribosomal protein L9 [Flaviflexus salsibiostraticola]AZN30283.1 50S ribosomal protein L9 [Flaviflexus salsibiostraticola]